jgi:hypothetical protein
MPNQFAQTIAKHKGWVAVGALVGGGGLLLMHERSKNAAASAPATDSSGTAYAYGYGSAAASAYGYGAYGTAGFESEPGLASTYYGYGPYAYGYGASGVGVGTSTPPTSAPAATNAQWAAAAQQSLVNEGFSSVTVAEALGEYITGGTLTSAQEQIVQAAIAAENYPPVAGASGYPPAMHASPPPGQTGTGTNPTPTPTTGSIAVPNVVGQRGLGAKAIVVAKGLKVVQDPKTTPKGKATKVTSTDPKAGTKVKLGSTVTIHVST